MSNVQGHNEALDNMKEDLLKCQCQCHCELNRTACDLVELEDAKEDYRRLKVSEQLEIS